MNEKQYKEADHMETPVRKRQQRFSIELELLFQISRMADDQEVSISDLINDAIRQYLNNHK